MIGTVLRFVSRPRIVLYGLRIIATYSMKRVSDTDLEMELNKYLYPALWHRYSSLLPSYSLHSPKCSDLEALKRNTVTLLVLNIE